MLIEFATSDNVFVDFERKLHEYAANPAITTALDVGGGRNPAIDPPDVERYHLQYTLLDISQSELDLAPSGYDKLCCDICSNTLTIENQFDFIFSMMLAEHVQDPLQFHRNIFRMLKPGGVALHLFPTLFTIPFAINRLMPERLAAKLLDVIVRREHRSKAKFPAYYRWCRGPTAKQLQRLKNIGFEVIEYNGYFGHRVYYQKLSAILKFHDWKSKFLAAHPSPWLTSYSIVTLRKPEN